MRQPGLPARLGLHDVRPLDWLGVAPFFVFAVLFLILPTAFIIIGAFTTADGAFTLDHLAGLASSTILGATWISVKISLLTALAGCVAGLLLSYHAALPSGPAIILSAGVVYLASILFGTRGALRSRLVAHRHRTA